MHIPVGPDEVFEFVSDTRNDPEWCPNVTDVRQTSGEGVAVGSAFAFHQTVEAGGRQLESDVEVEVVEVGERSIRWRVEDRFQTRDIRLTVAPDEDASTVSQTTTARFKRKPSLVTRWAYPRLAKRTLKDQFRHLATHFAD